MTGRSLRWGLVGPGGLGSAPALALLVVLSWTEAAHAKEPAADSDTVVDIRVEGLRRVEEDAALASIKTKVGAPLDVATLTADLRRVWETGFFRDVRIETERVEGGWRVIFVVVEKPVVKEVSYSGNDEISKSDIEKVVDVKPYTILNVEQLKRNVQKIKDLYVEKGYYLADVQYRLETVSEHEVNVIFEITENAKVMVKQLSFVGNKHLTDEEIASAMQTRVGNELSWLTQSGTYKEEFFQTDLFRIQALYMDHGFLTVKVGQPTATISPDRRGIYLSVPIDEGERYDIGKITFSGEVNLVSPKGKVLVDEETLRKRLTIEQGDIFNRTEMTNNIQAITDVYRDQGYAYANVSPNAKTDPKTRTVDLDLSIERGDLVYIGRIEIVGNTRTRDKVIRREMRVYEGQKYSSTLLQSSKARIYQLGYFETVDVNTNRGSAPNLMDVSVEVKEKSTGTFQIGAGFSSVESFIATAQISQDNFLGTGDLVSLAAQLSFGDFARQLATLQFYDPYFMDSRWSFGVNAYITQRYYQDFQRNATGISPSFGYPITPDLRVSAGYTAERLQVETTSSSGVALADLDRGNGFNSALNASIAYDTRDNRLFPSAGQYHMLSLEYSDGWLGASDDLQYTRAQLFMRYYQPLPLSFVLKLNATFGMVWSQDSNQRVAISERFFPGGIYSVRGFEPRSLGPSEAVLNKGDPNSRSQEFTIGGNKEAIFNLELEFPIIKSAGIKGVLFADAGNAYDDDQGFFYVGTPKNKRPSAYLMRSNELLQGGPPLGLYWSFGFGLRWFSPMGPLRFEWGIPITKVNPNDRGIIFEFTIGNFF